MSKEWRVKARNMLFNGYGVEDIAVRLSVELAEVRILVKALRASGMLAEGILASQTYPKNKSRG